MALLPFDDRDGLIWWDGKLIDWRNAKLHVLSHGLHYASAIFEGERAYSGNIFKLREHTERLINSGRILGFDIPWTAAQINAACIETLAANNLTDAYVRPLAWRGSEQMSISAHGSTIHLMIACWAWPNVFGADRLQGVKLGLASWKRPHPETAPTDSKAAGLYMIGTMSKHEADARGFDDALMLDWQGNVAEASGANIFLVIDGKLHTPRVVGFLDGITRQTVIALARRQGIEVIERTITYDELKTAQEVFITGTAAEVTPVRQIEDLHFTTGPVTQTLLTDYEALVRLSPEAVSQRLAA